METNVTGVRRRFPLQSAGWYETCPPSCEEPDGGASHLGSACAHIELAPPEVTPPDDDREFFVAAWCLDPTLIPDEKVLFIPEPNVCIPGNALYLDADEIVLNKLPGLRYLVRLRVVEYQDWSTPPPSFDEEGRDFHREEDSDSSGHNRRHPWLDDRSGWPRGPGYRSYRLADRDDAAPELGGRRGLTFQPRRDVMIGTFSCPIVPSRCCSKSGRPCLELTAPATVDIVASDENLPTTETDDSTVGHITRTETDPTRYFDPMLLDDDIARPPDSAPIKFDVALIDDVVMDVDRSVDAAHSFIADQLHDDLSLLVGNVNIRRAMVDDAVLLTMPCANDAGTDRIWDPIPEFVAASNVVAESASRIESEPMSTSIPTVEHEPAPNHSDELQQDTNAVPVTPHEGGTEAEPASPSALIASYVDRITALIAEPIIKTPHIRVPRRRVQPETLDGAGNALR